MGSTLWELSTHILLVVVALVWAAILIKSRRKGS